ncbi:MAG: ComF family protein [Leptolyngbyaceae cyanobacterium CSU_1_3]|nr:ComF family protein [Leptolyngbyaceae cyanobacterium CSU_1_3]
MLNPRLLLKEVCSLFLQATCPLCERPTLGEFCPTCEQQIQKCQFKNPAQFWQAQPAVFAWGAYQDALKRTIAHLKYDNQPALAEPLGQWLAQSWLAADLSRSRLIVVPIPMHPTKQQQRGYNQADLIAQSFCKFTGYPLRVRGLERLRSTEALFGQSAGQRSQSLAQAFGLGKEFRRDRPSAPVLLLDDIYTTGATVRSAIQTLRQAGITVHGVAVVAKPERWKT